VSSLAVELGAVLLLLLSLCTLACGLALRYQHHYYYFFAMSIVTTVCVPYCAYHYSAAAEKYMLVTVMSASEMPLPL
jgi:hypothetical protein